MVQTYEGKYPAQAILIQSGGRFLKLPYTYGIHYMVTICLWLLVHGNHTRIVFSYKNLDAYGFRFKKPYAYGIFSNMGFTNLMPIPILH